MYLILKIYCVEFGDTSMGQGDDEFVNNFPFNDFLKTKVREEYCYILPDKYVAHKARSYNDCTEYKYLFGNKESTIDHANDIKYL